MSSSAFCFEQIGCVFLFVISFVATVFKFVLLVSSSSSSSVCVSGVAFSFCWLIRFGNAPGKGNKMARDCLYETDVCVCVCGASREYLLRKKTDEPMATKQQTRMKHELSQLNESKRKGRKKMRRGCVLHRRRPRGRQHCRCRTAMDAGNTKTMATAAAPDHRMCHRPRLRTDNCGSFMMRSSPLVVILVQPYRSMQRRFLRWSATACVPFD